jgi:hypothetical protein
MYLSISNGITEFHTNTDHSSYAYCDGIVRVTAYAFRHDGVLRHLHTHNRAFPFIQHALYSGRNGHT